MDISYTYFILNIFYQSKMITYFIILKSGIFKLYTLRFNFLFSLTYFGILSTPLSLSIFLQGTQTHAWTLFAPRWCSLLATSFYGHCPHHRLGQWTKSFSPAFKEFSQRAQREMVCPKRRTKVAGATWKHIVIAFCWTSHCLPVSGSSNHLHNWNQVSF